MKRGNLGGLLGCCLSGGVGYLVGVARMTSGHTGGDAVAWGALAGCFAAGLFALLWDRTVVPEFWASYRALVPHFVNGIKSGADYDRRERVAFFIAPLIFYPYVMPVVAGVMWLFGWNVARHSSHPADHQFYGLYLAATLIATLLIIALGRATVTHRLLEREIAFNSMPTLATPYPTDGSSPEAAPSGKPVAAKRGTKNVPKPTAADLARMRKRGRRDACLAIILGLGLLIFHHYVIVLHDHKVSMKAVFCGPMVIMVAITALFEPLIMYRHLPVGKHFPKSVLLLTLMAMAIGLAGGYGLYHVYMG